MNFTGVLDSLHQSGNFRKIPPEISSGGVDFSSNDYLGLGARCEELQERFFADPHHRKIPMTSSASRLLAAHQEEYYRLERLLAGLYGREVLLYNSGYHANVGVMSAIADARTMVVADKLVHASIIDGIMLSKAPFTRFRHNDYGHLERILDKECGNHDTVVVVTESVFSMDGDMADIDRLVELKRKHGNVMLYVDEAHAFGVLGQQGLGMVHESAGGDEVDIIVGTFGKALASMGAFVAVSQEIKDFLINRSRSFIFSTAISPMSCAWTRFMVECMSGMDAERRHLRDLAKRLGDGLSMLSGKSVEPSHIEPLIVGDARRVVELSRLLAGEGYKVLPIRTPTVPPGTERLRFSLSAAMTLDEIDGVVDALGRVMERSGVELK